MKKTIITISVVAVMAVAAVCIFCTVKANENPFLNANVEALARGESAGFGPMCSKTGKLGTYRMKLCKDNCSGGYDLYDLDVVAYCNY